MQAHIVIVALVDPHAGVQRIGVQPVAIALPLRIQHHAVELAGGGNMGLSGLKHRAFKQEAAIDVHDDLRGLHQAVFQKRKARLVVGGLAHLTAEERFVEDGSRLGKGHGRVGHQHGHALQAHVVPAVSQLMRQRAHIAEAAHEVGQHPADLHLVEARAERAALLALAGIEVNPAVFKRLVDEPAHFGVHLGKDAHQQLPRLLCGIPPGIPSHGRKQVIEGQAVRVAQQLRLFAQVAPEIRQRLADGGPHGVQRLTVHAAFVKLLREHVGVSPGLAHGERLALDAA